MTGLVDDGKSIRVQFGERLITAFADFARTDLKSVSELRRDEFSHISDASLQVQLTEVFYGARWIYKLGLALLTKNEERAARVGAQIVDYAAVVEGVLSHCVAHAIQGGHARGSSYLWADPDFKKRALNWKTSKPEGTINRRPFWWLVRIAREIRDYRSPP